MSIVVFFAPYPQGGKLGCEDINRVAGTIQKRGDLKLVGRDL
ncbi:MAG: hypothetical protein ACOY9Y_02855 [Bacillota bacterium]